MRRSRKKEVIRIFAALHKAHKILNQIGTSNVSEAKDVFTTCQNGAIQIGNEIEHWEGEGTQTVRLLEDYCETVYQCAVSQPMQRGADLYQTMEKSLLEAEDSFNREIPNDKLEVVFFPYQASMWDSFASVWKAASNDASCHVSVIPIPYFEKNPDGSFGQMHYEGDRFPADVPITPWETYQVAQQFPDLIFIHNPYDQNNFVTSVHPNYYASVLEKLTGNLVYIPYYLFVNNQVFENTLMTSASLYADYFIIQSKETCTKCIQIYDNFLKKNKLAGKLKQGKDKFLPLGSPFADSLHQQISIKDMPQSWQDIVSKHGGNPKIVMYNTHLTNLMCMKENNFFKKINAVFETFKSREDIILLWRPHPLTWQTIHSMNPQAAEKYQALVDSYQSEAWGIFDDSPRVNQSVILADAYYGDWSSLITMFHLLGKPALLQDLEIFDNIANPPEEIDFQTLVKESELGLKDYLSLINNHIPAQKETIEAGTSIWNYFKEKLENML